MSRFVLMLVMVGPMLPVTSTRRMMSGLGGIWGVVTSLSTLKEKPGSMPVLDTEAGETPGMARAGPKAKARAVVMVMEKCMVEMLVTLVEVEADTLLRRTQKSI